MSKFIVALTLPEFGSTPNSPTSGFYKYYLRSNWLKVLNSAGLQRDVVLDRPLDGFVADNPPCLPITATDTVLTAFEKFQCIMDNLAIITGSLKAATPWTAEHTTTNNDQYQVGTIVYYMNSVYKCIAANDSIIPTNTLYWQYLGVASGYYSQEQADWDATTGSSYIRNKPTIPPAPVQSDWTQTNTSALDYIKNKPTNFGFDPVACNEEIITDILNSCSTPLHIQKDYSANVLIGENGGVNVGVNTTSPTAKVHIKGSTADSTAYAFKANNSSDNPILTVRNDEKVGVRTTAPTATVHIVSPNGNIDTTGLVTNLQIERTDGASVYTVQDFGIGGGNQSIRSTLGSSSNTNTYQRLISSDGTITIANESGNSGFMFQTTSTIIGFSNGSSGSNHFTNFSKSTGNWIFATPSFDINNSTCPSDTKVTICGNSGTTLAGNTDYALKVIRNVDTTPTITSTDLLTVRNDGITTIKDVLVLKPRASAPSSPEEGMMYYESGSYLLKIYSAGTWETIAFV